MDKIKVLHFIPAFNFGGIETIVMNLFRNIDREKFEFDFLVEGNTQNKLTQEIQELGGKIYRLDKYKRYNIAKYAKQLDTIFKHEKFDVIHAHTVTRVPLVLSIAKKNNIKTRIMHAHIDKFSNNKIECYIKELINKINTMIATEFVACSVNTAKYYYRRKYKQAFVINNAVNVWEYKFNLREREKIRRKLGINDNILFGFVGRLMPEKNIDFLGDIFFEIQKRNMDAKFLIIGDGILKTELKKKLRKLNLENNVILLGKVDNVSKYYSAIDCLIMPSIKEGFPLVAVEGQVSGIPMLLSKNITKEVAITNLVHFESLEESSEKWAKKALKIVSMDNNRDETFDIVEKSNFNIVNAALKVEKYYEKLVEKVK